MSNVRPIPTLTNILPSPVPGIDWTTRVGVHDASVLALLYQMASTQWLRAVELRARQTQADAVYATANAHATGMILDTTTSGSSAKPVTVRRTAPTQRIKEYRSHPIASRRHEGCIIRIHPRI